jgi:hypothetical protein
MRFPAYLFNLSAKQLYLLSAYIYTHTDLHMAIWSYEISLYHVAKHLIDCILAWSMIPVILDQASAWILFITPCGGQLLILFSKVLPRPAEISSAEADYK